MNQSPLLEFESSAFLREAGEDEHTNPGIFGKSLARWLSEKLREQGVPASEAVAEDFGWCIPVTVEAGHLYVACSSTEVKPNQWRVFVFAEGGLFSKLFGKNKSAQSVAELFGKVRHVLKSAHQVSALSEANNGT